MGQLRTANKRHNRAIAAAQAATSADAARIAPIEPAKSKAKAKKKA